MSSVRCGFGRDVPALDEGGPRVGRHGRRAGEVAVHDVVDTRQHARLVGAVIVCVRSTPPDGPGEVRLTRPFSTSVAGGACPFMRMSPEISIEGTSMTTGEPSTVHPRPISASSLRGTEAPNTCRQRTSYDPGISRTVGGGAYVGPIGASSPPGRVRTMSPWSNSAAGNGSPLWRKVKSWTTLGTSRPPGRVVATGSAGRRVAWRLRGSSVPRPVVLDRIGARNEANRELRGQHPTERDVAATSTLRRLRSAPLPSRQRGRRCAA